MSRVKQFEAMSSKDRLLRLLEIGAKEVRGTITDEDIADREAIQEIRFANGEMEAVVKEWERDPEYHGPETAKRAAEFREEQARRKTQEATGPKMVVVGPLTDEKIKSVLRDIRAVTADFIGDSRIVVDPLMEDGKAWVVPAWDMAGQRLAHCECPDLVAGLPDIHDVRAYLGIYDALLGDNIKGTALRNSGIIDILLDESAYYPRTPPKRKLVMYSGKNRRYTNIQRLNYFRKHMREPERNGEWADAISYRLIQKAMAVVLALPEEYQPHVFPTAWGTIQFEYGSLKKRDPRLVIEMALHRSSLRWETKITGEDGVNEGVETFKTNTANIVRRIRAWHDAMKPPKYVMTADISATGGMNDNNDVFAGEQP